MKWVRGGQWGWARGDQTLLSLARKAMTFLLRQHKILGVVFLALVVLSGYLVYATFTKKFTDYDEVKVETSNIGLQLPARADVKIRASWWVRCSRRARPPTGPS